ncbi:Sec1-binding region of Mso1-domain-containing protein [Annulohypoxylon maeteangense]|uniref:Sec1-binding region of Mso1-domain-containing protein n=1 Tax=Annulohypoxylon maeteangense TaxID=1927788 RepID=UPI002007B112|nr:Sec1-binding region of Mso1-domain-containing protein [Annulohypoxylon maeteangense]KAI0884428.1 Sec1-binding region of Mso1-domain-containing protein [Annulohypoxylon maeteangense]
MSAWYSNIVGATSSKISNLQRTFLNSEADGDTEDDTYVCRVLRSYYTEKGQSFPGWLPPDPKAPPPVAAVYAQPASVGSRYGGLTQQPQGGGLSSLWDNNPVSQPQDAQSLRRGRGAPPAARMGDPRGSSSSSNLLRTDDVPARPLPSQRAGSYQTPGGNGYARDTGTAPPATGGSAQDRLKQRLFGGSRTASPAGSGPFNPPPQQGGSRGGGGDSYEDRFTPGGMYDGGSGGRSAGRRPGISGGGGLPSGPRMR